MALFESGPRKTLKKIRKFAEEGSVNKVSTTVKEEKDILLEEADVAVELVELLLEIGHPNLASGIAEEVMRRHRPVAVDVREILIGRLGEFSRSTDLLRVIWRNYMDMHDFRGALDVLRKAEEPTVNSLFDIIREKMESSMRFDGTVHPEADQASLVEWALHLHRERRTGEAIEFLWKVCREVEYPHRDMPLLAFWISNQMKDLDTLYYTPLMGIAAVTGKMDQALQFASRLSESEPTPDEATDAAAVIEKYMVPVDRSGKSAALLAEMYTAAGKTDAASKTLESIYSKSLDREELESAIEDLVAHPDSGAAPQLLAAQMNLEKGRLEDAMEAVEKAFEAGDAEPSRLLEVCRRIIDSTGDSSGNIAMKLAHFLSENGEIEDAVFSLVPIIDTDPSWVFEHVQKLISRDRNDAQVLTLLAAVLFETGKQAKAIATLELLSRKRDRKFCTEAVGVLDAMDRQVEKYPDLREARALFRLRSEREMEAADDWFRLLLRGRTPVPEGQQLLSREDVQIGTVADIVGSGFSPSSPWQAFIVAMVCLREDNAEQANSYMALAMEDPELQADIVRRIDTMPVEQRDQLDLKAILTRVSEGPAAETVASILQKIGGDDEWKVALATSLKWDKPAEVAQFRFRYLITRNRVVLAGSSFEKGSIGEPLIESVAEACAETVRDNYSRAIELLEKPVVRPWSSAMARKVLEFILPKSPANGNRIRKLIARSHRTEKNFDEVSAVLEPVLEEDGVLELLEEMAEENPGEYPLVRSLTRTAGLRGDFERFQRYSAVMLEINGEAAEEVVGMASAMASEKSSGHAYIYAARIASRYRIQADTDGLVTSALLLEPELAEEGLLQEFHRMGPVPRAVCALAAGEGEEFARLLRDNGDLNLPLNQALLESGVSAWSPGEDGEPLLALSEQAIGSQFADRGEDLLCLLASQGEEPWRTRASMKLLDSVEKGTTDRTRFWSSVRVDKVIAEAMERLLPDDYSGIDREELKVIAPAVLHSGQGIRRLFQLAEDGQLFPRDDMDLRRELAVKLLESYRELEEEEGLSTGEMESLVDVLLSAGMLAEASEIARISGSDGALSMVREGLRQARSAVRDSGAGSGDPSAAFDLIVTGRPDLALDILGDAEDRSHPVFDARALALWNMGYRQQAIHTWMADFRENSSGDSLKRLYWALGQSGASLERAALKRFLAGRYPEIAGILSRDDREYDPDRLDTISGFSVDMGIEGGK